jgi:hypothetical protein
MGVCCWQKGREGANRQLLYAARLQVCWAICKGLLSGSAIMSRKSCVVDPEPPSREKLSLGKCVMYWTNTASKTPAIMPKPSVFAFASMTEVTRSTTKSEAAQFVDKGVTLASGRARR